MRTGFLTVTILLLASQVFANSKKPSIFEVGAGFSMVSLPHYAGSDESEYYALPFPYLIYQTDRVSLNREGLKGHLAEGSRWDLDLSLAGALPVNSDDNEARRGMPDLDWVGLAGPSLNYRILQTEVHSVKFMFPVRMAAVTDFSRFETIGWQAAPGVRWEHDFQSRDTNWRLIGDFSAYYQSNKFNDYFYSVDQTYVTPERDFYKAESGFAGTQTLLGITRRRGNFWTGAFIRYRSLNNAEFEDSPLVREKDNFYVGVAFAWIIHSQSLD